MLQSDSPRDDAAAKLAALLSPSAVDVLLADAEASGTPIDGPDGLLSQMTKAVLNGPWTLKSPIISATSTVTRPVTGRAILATVTAAKPC